MLLRLTLLLSFCYFGTVTSDDCSDILKEDNSTLTFELQNNYSLTLSFVNIRGPVRLDLVSSWGALHLSAYSLDIKDDSDEIIILEADYPYIYDLEVHCTPADGKQTKIQTFSVIAGKSKGEETLTLVVGIGMNIFLAIAMLVMGCDLEFDIILAYLKKPIGPIIGLCCQFLGMPLISYGLGYIFLSDQPVARLGLLMIGSSPGGSSSNFWTVLFKGDMNLSVTMTFCSSIASFGMTTFWVSILGATILADSGGLSIPYIRIFISLLSLIVPLCLGILFAKKKPKMAKRISKTSRPIFLTFLLVVTGFGLYTNRYFWVLVSWREIVSGLLLGVSGYIMGVIAASLAGLKRDQTIAVSIETAIQNPGIAIAVLQSNFASPYADIGMLPVAAFILCATGPPMLLTYGLMRAVQYIRGIDEVDNETQDLNSVNQNSRATTAQDNPGFEYCGTK